MFNKLLKKYHVYWVRLAVGVAMYPISWLLLYAGYNRIRTSILRSSLPVSIQSIMLSSAHAQLVTTETVMLIILLVWAPILFWCSIDLKKDYEYGKMLRLKQKISDWVYEHDE
jgi:hypothetical protein